MAGVAPQQRGGTNSTTIGMIVSIVVAVALLGVLIWLITQQEQLRATADSATAARTRVTKENDEKNKSIQLLCSRLSGNANDGAANAIGKLNAALEKITTDDKIQGVERIKPGNGAAANLDLLYQIMQEGQDAREKAEGDRDKLSASLASAEKRNTDLQKKFGDELKKLADNVQELQAAKSEYEKLKSSEIETLASQIGAKQDELNAVREQRAQLGRIARSEIDDRERLLGEQRRALSSLRGPPAEGAQELASARKPVGTVLRALPGDSLVHLDLGREDNASLGMTFSIYSAGERVPADGRGKAQVEVVSLGRRTSECRVTSPPSPDNPILDGDLAGNIILSRDKGKKQRFCLIGAFDTDFDGQVDANGAMAVRALIEKYGGAVVDTVDATTDYVVVGIEPPASQVESELPPPRPAKAKPAAESTEPATEEAPAAEESSADESTTEESDDDAEGSDEEEAPKDEEDAAGDDTSSDEEAGESGDTTEEESDEDKPADSGDSAEEGASDEESTTEEEADEDKKEDGEKESPPADDEAESDSTTEDAAPAEESDAEKPAKAAAAVEEEIADEAAPSQSPEDFELDLTVDPRKQRARGEREKYEDALRRAEQLAIPRLPPDRFFNFIGLESGPSAANRLAP